jgi:hypothetical protein
VSATIKFYTGFLVFLAIVIGLSFYSGYRAGVQRERAALHDARRLVPVGAPGAPHPAPPLVTPLRTP